MSALDWVVLTIYLLAMVGLSVFLGRGQSDQDDYYVGGRNLKWWAVGLSTMATQTSAVSFVSIPAFVALREGGGLSWLQYELAVPIAMLLVMVFLLPLFRKLELVSVYEYLEMRFSRGVRLMMSGVFLVSRGLATGFGVFGMAIVLQVCLDIPLWATILIIGVVTVIYDTIGGMKAVVYSDVIQMVFLVGGLVLCVVLAWQHTGGLSAILGAYEPERFDAYVASSGIADGTTAPFWGFLIGGLFLYMSYYGTDQSQVQRELSAPTIRDTRRSLVLNGIARFPLTILYLFLGLAVGAVAMTTPELAASIPADKPDYLVPQFIRMMVPAGLRGLLFAAILAAAMSSLDSALNSLSAATMRDFVTPLLKNPDSSLELRLSKITTVIWGAVITGLAFVASAVGGGAIIEGINKVGSAFYGPILAAFLVGILWKRTTPSGVVSGVVAGVGFNIWLWILDLVLVALGHSELSTSWMWWNATGLVVAVVVAVFVSLFGDPPDEKKTAKTTLSFAGLWQEERKYLGVHFVLVAYFVLIVLVVLYARPILESLI